MMRMKKRTQLLFALLLLFSVSGCAHVISKDIRNNSDLSLTLKQVLGNPNAYSGKSVVWGGEIIQVINEEDGTTEIEIFQEPLNFRGEPKEAAPSEGRFLVLDDGFLDPDIYWEGRRITVAGELQGERIEPLGEMYYRYPLIINEQIYLWPDFSPYPYYGYYPWSYYDPWWGYPYGGWGFGSYYHHHHHHYPYHHFGKGSYSYRSGKSGFVNGTFGKRGSLGGGSGGSSRGGGRDHR
jgi:outer membrane lipoprotein